MDRKQVTSFIIQLVLFLILIVAQISFLSNLNLYVRSFNFVLVTLVFLVLLTDPLRFLIFAILAGLVFDMYSGLPYGVFMVSFLTTSIIVGVLSNNMFTNRSLYSLLVLGVIASVSYHLIFLLVMGFIYIIGASEIFVTTIFWKTILYQVVNSAILIMIGFWLVNGFSNKFRPTFLKS